MTHRKIYISLVALLTLISCTGSGPVRGDGNPAPFIAWFTASPPGEGKNVNTILRGQNAVLQYSFSGGTGVITPTVGNVNSEALSTVSPLVTTTYTLVVTNSTGKSVSSTATVNVNSPPTVSVQPLASQTIPYGSPATLNILATATDALSYQWYKSGKPLLGSTQNSLTLSSVTEDAVYRCDVTNTLNGTLNTTPSNNAAIYVNRVLITEQPVGGSTVLGAGIRLMVNAEGSGLISYQWLKNGIAISLETSSSYITTDLVDNDVISLQMISNSTSCLTTNSIISNTIQTEVHPGAPATPMAISGDTTQCTSLSNQVYSIASVLNASTYTWSVPAGWAINSGSGTTSIVVTIGSSSGTSNVTVTAGNGCGTSTQQLLPVAVSSSSSNPINLTSANDGQIKCINTALANITYSSSGGTGASFSGLPTGVSGAYSGGTITISGTPTVAGSYTYTITLTGGGCDYTKTGTITVTAANTVSLSSSSGTNAQTKCINTAITNITYSTTGATSVTVDGLPSGVEDNWSGGVLTISGTPTVAGVHTYTVTLNGGCGNVTTTGTISVTAANTITLATGSSTQT
ncbi:MAG: hypothetical protein RL533_549, partial [Pseudomonadota bacterium]